MARRIIEIDGKKFQVCISKSVSNPCKGCYFLDNENMMRICKKNMPCLEFDYNSEYFHYLKELQKRN